MALAVSTYAVVRPSDCACAKVTCTQWAYICLASYDAARETTPPVYYKSSILQSS